MFVNTALTRVQLVSRSGQSPSKTLVRGELYVFGQLVVGLVGIGRDKRQLVVPVD